jgi:hypothetical protein
MTKYWIWAGLLSAASLTGELRADCFTSYAKTGTVCGRADSVEIFVTNACGAAASYQIQVRNPKGEWEFASGGRIESGRANVSAGHSCHAVAWRVVSGPTPAAIVKKPRPGWVCPGGGSFDTCSDECKWIYMGNGFLDSDHESKCGARIGVNSAQGQRTMKLLYDTYERAYSSCSLPADPNAMVVNRTPCNYVAGMAMKEVYGVRDFERNGGFMAAADMSAYLRAQSSRADGLWMQVKGEDAAYAASLGKPVLASAPEHVGVVLGGPLSSNPMVYSMFKDDLTKPRKPGDKGPVIPMRCMPCTAVGMFHAMPEFYVRIK